MKNHLLQGVLRTLVCLFFCTGSFAMMAQEAAPAKEKKQAPQYEMREVSGCVYDAATKSPLVGVNVQALGNRQYSAMTDENGNYKINVPVFVTALYIHIDEYNPVQIAIKGESGQDAYLYSGLVRPLYFDGTQLQDVHSMKLANTSTVTVENDIENGLNGSVRTINRGGLPGQGGVMFVNGINSLNSNAQPLIVIDGVIQDMQYDRTALHDGFLNNVFNIMDPEDIESVEVLKTGTALYGARGANGVIRINTRRGKSQVTRIKARVYGGFESVPEKVSVMDASQYRNYITEFLGTTKNAEYLSSSTSSAFMNIDPNYLFYPQYHNNTDWQKNLYRSAFTQNYKVSVEGGDDIAMYNLSLGYVQSNATAKNNDFNRLNIRFNTDVFLFRNLTAAMDIAYARNAYNILDNGWANDYSTRNISSPNVLGQIQSPFIDPYEYFVKYENGGLHLGHANNVYSGQNYDAANNPFRFAEGYGFSGLVNPYWILQNGDGNNKNYQEQTQFNLNIAPRYQVNKYLVIQDRFSYILNRSNEKYYLPKNGTPKKEVEGLGDVQSVIRSQFGKETTLYNELSANYTRNFGPHYLNATAGFRLASYSYTDNRVAGYNNDNDKMPNMSYGLQYKSYGGTSDGWMNLSYFLNASYNYRNLYFVDFATTLESSSRFGKQASEGLKLAGVKWGVFPSIQAGWLISNESWFDFAPVNYLKLTAGYEESGNDNVDYYATRTYFDNVLFLERATALVLANIENPTIQWETTRRFNVGLQANFLKDRIALAVNFFHGKTSNLLTRKAVSDITGLRFMWDNDGALKNTGVEVNLSGVIVNSKDWRWQLGASMGHYSNEIAELPTTSLNYLTTYALDANGVRDEATAKTIHGYLNSVYGDRNVLTAVGRPAGVFYGYKTAGVFASDAEASQAGLYGYLRYPTGISAQPYRNFHAGDVHFVDQNGDGWISEADMVEIGNPNPSIFGNIFTNVSWKDLTLDVVFKYSLGNDVYNFQRAQLESANNIWNQTTAVVNRWRYDGQSTDVPRTMSEENDQWVNNERFSDRWIEDGSFLKLKKVRLTYRIPVSLSWLQGLAVWAEANNVFTLTKYLGSDPEFAAGNSVLYQGIDAGWLPSCRSFNFGVNINL